MSSIIFSVRNIVIIIVIAEFLKSFLIGDKFRKYITISVNILVLSFIISQITNVSLDYDFEMDFPTYKEGNYQNTLKEEYENRVCEEIKKHLREGKIMVNSISVEAEENYDIRKITIHINGNKEKAEEILKGLDLKNYEIITDNK